eukprot:GHVU01180939.1.p1 GENE.GHVU01180939.1~~GHVU01180939.1.p1  ORF type:complete len:112 (+),score=3.61 GHVU01180939.1:354-689(+)
MTREETAAFSLALLFETKAKPLRSPSRHSFAANGSRPHSFGFVVGPHVNGNVGDSPSEYLQLAPSNTQSQSRRGCLGIPLAQHEVARVPDPSGPSNFGQIRTIFVLGFPRF